MVPAAVHIDLFIRSPAVTEEIMECPFRGMDRDSQPAGEHVKATDMITVFMGDQHPPDLPCIKRCHLHPEKGLFQAQSRINKKCTASAFEKYAVAFASACKYCAPHRPIIGRSRIRAFNSLPIVH
jgi:hypothetical protein